jgi:HSP20 family protein
MAISRYDPFHEALSLRHAMDQLFAQSFVNPAWVGSSQAAFAPMDVYETDQGYQVRVSLPGVKPEDIDLTVGQNMLTIRGRYGTSPQERAEGQERAGNWLVREIHTGSFERSITFDRPIDPDNIETSYENGVLAVLLPVTQASRPRRISIAGSQSQPRQIDVDTTGQQGQERMGTASQQGNGGSNVQPS